jgi:hypothetical protein
MGCDLQAKLDEAEEAFCAQAEIQYVRFPLRNWEAPDGSSPAIRPTCSSR